MTTLGFVSAILPDSTLEQVFAIAADLKFDCVELMCWPVGKADRRYAGITHLDVTGFDTAQATRVNDLARHAGVAISGLGYYPNPLSADRAEARLAVEHLRRVIAAAALLGVGTVNTFVGGDPARSVAGNWPRFLETWTPLVQFAEQRGVRLGIENCPMYYTRDEWPGGKNIAYSPAIWRQMFAAIPAPHFGLNYDPSHLVWQQIDYVKPLREFASRLFHVHAKDVRLDRRRLDDVGILATPLEYHTPKLPGLGEIQWEPFCAELNAVGYTGSICIEVEDRDDEGSLDSRIAALSRSADYLRPFISGKAAR